MSRPSLVTRFTRWLRAVPVPARILYPVLLVTATAYSLIARRIAGLLPAGPWSINDLYDVFSGPLVIVSILAIYNYLEDEIPEAVRQSRAIANLTDDEFAHFTHELVVIPLWPHLTVSVLSIAGAVDAAINTYGLESVKAIHLPVLAEWALAAILTFGFSFHVIRLIVLIGRFYAGPIRLSLYNLAPIYELSTVTGKAGLLLLVVWYINLPFSIDERVLETWYVLLTLIMVSLTPLAAFLVPQAVLSRRLNREKTRLTVGVSQQLESAFDKLRQQLEHDQLDRIKSLQSAIEALMAEKQFIESIPTWPWRLGTFRVALTAVLLPVVVWLIQQILDRFLSF